MRFAEKVSNYACYLLRDVILLLHVRVLIKFNVQNVTKFSVLSVLVTLGLHERTHCMKTYSN